MENYIIICTFQEDPLLQIVLQVFWNWIDHLESMNTNWPEQASLAKNSSVVSFVSMYICYTKWKNFLP